MLKEEIEARILFEDNHLIVVNKLSGELIQGDHSGDMPLLEKVRSYIKVKYHKPHDVFCGLIHRLDRPVSGVVVFAKTSKALTRMNNLLKEQKIQKIYHAIVEGKIPDKRGTLVHFLKKNETQNKTYVSITEKENYKRAELKYEMVACLRNYTLVEIELITGRHHQIRAQLSAMGTPIKGDLKYGARRSNLDGSISLHAWKIVFEHPVSHQKIELKAPILNKEFAKLWALADC